METEVLAYPPLILKKNETIDRTFRREKRRLFDFIRRRVPVEEDAEDILQDVLFEFTEAYDVVEPIEMISAWLFKTARNKITDLFRKKKPLPFSSIAANAEHDGEESLSLEDLLPELGDGADVKMARKTLMEQLELALAELPAEQREAFILHELEEMSFKEMAEKAGLPVNTMISRKRYAVLFLRERMRSIYLEFINTKN